LLKEFVNRFGAQVVRLNTKDETVMVHAYRKGICLRPFSESLIRSRPKTLAEIRHRAVAHITTKGEMNEKRACVVPTRPQAPACVQPVRVHEAATFNKMQLSPDQLRPYDGCLYGFAGNQVEMRGHLELRTTFTDGVASRMENIRYLVVNVVSAYNILLGRPSLNRLRAVASTRHMKMKLPDLSGRLITIKSNQQGSEAGVILEASNGMLIEQALRFAFKASNNQTKYEALIAGMLLAKEMGAQSLLAKSDSLLVTGQVTGEYQAKDPQIAAYLGYV